MNCSFLDINTSLASKFETPGQALALVSYAYIYQAKGGPGWETENMERDKKSKGMDSI